MKSRRKYFFPLEISRRNNKFSLYDRTLKSKNKNKNKKRNKKRNVTRKYRTR